MAEQYDIGIAFFDEEENISLKHPMFQRSVVIRFKIQVATDCNLWLLGITSPCIAMRGCHFIILSINSS